MTKYNTLKELVEIDSPTGYTENAGRYIFDLLKRKAPSLYQFF